MVFTKKSNEISFRCEFLEKLLFEKDESLEKLKGTEKNTDKSQDLHAKIKKLKEKIEEKNAETEEIKRVFLVKSEKDNKYIEVLKLEIEKLRSKSENINISQKKTSKN